MSLVIGPDMLDGSSQGMAGRWLTSLRRGLTRLLTMLPGNNKVQASQESVLSKFRVEVLGKRGPSVRYEQLLLGRSSGMYTGAASPAAGPRVRARRYLSEESMYLRQARQACSALRGGRRVFGTKKNWGEAVPEAP